MWVCVSFWSSAFSLQKDVSRCPGEYVAGEQAFPCPFRGCQPVVHPGCPVSQSVLAAQAGGSPGCVAGLPRQSRLMGWYLLWSAGPGGILLSPLPSATSAVRCQSGCVSHPLGVQSHAQECDQGERGQRCEAETGGLARHRSLVCDGGGSVEEMSMNNSLKLLPA